MDHGAVFSFKAMPPILLPSNYSGQTHSRINTLKMILAAASRAHGRNVAQNSLLSSSERFPPGKYYMVLLRGQELYSTFPIDYLLRLTTLDCLTANKHNND